MARTSFVCETNDGEVQISGGQVVAASDPVVKGREDLFEPVTPPTAGEAS
jgi:hypothetical protein